MIRLKSGIISYIYYHIIQYFFVGRENANQGRFFLKCRQGCFVWEDELSLMYESAPFCKQHHIEMTKKRVSMNININTLMSLFNYITVKDTPNKGRNFFTCPKGCFQWESGFLHAMYTKSILSTQTEISSESSNESQWSAKVSKFVASIFQTYFRRDPLTSM